jgi:uncharacterized protein YjlB
MSAGGAYSSRMATNGPDTHRFEDDGSIPNSELPVLIYHRVGEVAGDAAACEGLFDRNGWWRMWRDGIYPFHHFHSTAHEALGVVSGQATVVLGGPKKGQRFEFGAGDVAILPAGTGHCNEGAGDDFLVVGAYPRGQDWDLRRGDPAEHDEVLENIKRVPLPEADPVHGADGPLLELWRT